jgi:glutamine synthetase adenylyltransferase
MLETYDIDGSVEILRDYCLLWIGHGPGLLEMHGLVQLATRSWLERYAEIEKWRQIFVKKLYDAFLRNTTYMHIQEWERYQLLLPHVKSAMCQQPTATNALLNLANLLLQVSAYTSVRRYMSDHVVLSKQAFDIRMEIRG